MSLVRITDDQYQAHLLRMAEKRRTEGKPALKRQPSKAVVEGQLTAQARKQAWKKIEADKALAEAKARSMQQAKAAIKMEVDEFLAKRATKAAKEEEERQFRELNPFIDDVPRMGEVVVTPANPKPTDSVEMVAAQGRDEDELNAEAKLLTQALFPFMDGRHRFTYMYLDQTEGWSDKHDWVGEFNKRAIRVIVFTAERYQRIDAINITAWPILEGKEQDTSLRESVDINCVIKAIYEVYNDAVPPQKATPLSMAKTNKLHKIIEKYKLQDNGVTKAIMHEISRAVGARIVVIGPAGNSWVDTDPNNTRKRKIAWLYAHNNHATVNVPLTDLSKCKIVYTDNCSSAVKDLHQRARYFITMTDHSQITINPPHAVWTGHQLYKVFQPSKITGDVEDDENEAFRLCFDRQQFIHKQWRVENNLRPLRGVYFDLFRNADTPLTSQKFVKYDNHTNYWLYDMNRAYPSFKSHPLYKRFLLTAGFVKLYNTTGIDVMHTISRPGISHVSQITWFNDFVESCGWIHEQQWYNNIVLYTLVTEGWADIAIDISCICLQADDLEFPFSGDKREDNQFIGRLIGGASAQLSTEYTRVFDSECDQVLWEYDKNPLCHSTRVYNGLVDGEMFVCAQMKCDESKSQLHQIHGCILAYQQTTMMKAMVYASKQTQIIAYNTDGFHVANKLVFSMEDTESQTVDTPLRISDLPGDFKVKREPIMYHCTFDGMSECLVGHKQSIDLLPAYDVAVPELPIVLITGPAGCGKSYQRIEKTPGWDSVVCCPTNALVADTRDRVTPKNADGSLGTPFTRVETYHLFFGIWMAEVDEEKEKEWQEAVDKMSPERRQNAIELHEAYLAGLKEAAERRQQYLQGSAENIILDELPLITGNNITDIVKKCTTWRMCIDLIGDIRQTPTGYWLTDQRLPVNKHENPIELNTAMKKFKFTHKEIISTVRRQSAEDSAWIDALRGLPAAEMRQRILAKCGGYKDWRTIISDKTMGLAATHKLCHAYNHDILGKFNPTEVPARHTKTRKENKVIIAAKGSIVTAPISHVWCDRTSSKHKVAKYGVESKKGECMVRNYAYELAYFRTADSVQGQSIDQQYVVDISPINKKHPDADCRFLYVAISRCRRLSDILIVDRKRQSLLESTNPYMVDKWDKLAVSPSPVPLPAQITKVATTDYHIPDRKAYYRLAEAQEIAHNLPGAGSITYIITRDELDCAQKRPSFRVWKDIGEVYANYPVDKLCWVHEMIETHRPQKLKVDLDNFKHDSDAYAVMHEMEHVLTQDLGIADPMVEVAFAHGPATGDDGQIYWKRSAHMRVTNYCVPSCYHAAIFSNLVRARLPERLQRCYDKIDVANKGIRMLFSTKNGRQLVPGYDYETDDIESEVEAFSVTSTCKLRSDQIVVETCKLIEHELLEPSASIVSSNVTGNAREFDIAMKKHPEEYRGWTIRRVTGSTCFLDRSEDVSTNCGLCPHPHTSDNYKIIRKQQDGTFVVGCMKSKGRTRPPHSP